MKKLLKLMGIPIVEAPCEAEAQWLRENGKPEASTPLLRMAAKFYGTAANLDVRDDLCRARLEALRSLF